MRFSRLCPVRSVVSLVAAAAVVAAGCGEPTIDREKARSYVEQWAETAEADLEEHAAREAGSRALEEELSERARRDEEKLRSKEPFYGILVDEVYRDRDYEPALVGSGSLTDRGEAVLEVLRGVEDHGLEAEDYELEALEEAVADWREQTESVETFEGLEPTQSDREEAVEWLASQPKSEFELTESNRDALSKGLLEADDRGGRLGEAVEEYRRRQSSIAEAAAVLERRLAVGLARYAREQRYSHIKDIFVHPRHWDYYNEGDVEDSGLRPDSEKGPFRGGQVWREAANIASGIAEDNRVEILDDGIRQTVREVLETDEPAERIAAIAPQHPQYEALVEEYRRYREIVDNGGWEEVPRDRSIGPGRSAETVAALKERLRAEGLFPDDVEIDETWGEELTDAIREYQKTHQLEVDGRLDHVFWYSLNVPARRRLEQIKLNLDRWRTSDIRHDEPTYAFVNIPDFTVELWHEQQRDMRFATVVGNNDKMVNPMTDEAEHSNRTPRMAAYIDRVIYNPYWNVTDRIRAQDILPQVKASIETKYALKFDHYLREAQAGREDVAERNVPLAEITGAVGLPDGDDGEKFAKIAERIDIEALDDQELQARLSEYEEAEGDETEDGESEDGEAESEQSARVAGIDMPDVLGGGGEEPESKFGIDDLTPEQREELKAELIADKTRSALSEWTTFREVRTEKNDRVEQKRFFKTSKLRRLESELFGDDTEALESFRARFPYLDWETGEVDVTQTDPDHIPAWYEENGYEVVRPGNEEWEYVREEPGDENALGAVKIIFPNYDNIYLHDTPKKNLFSAPVRGFSHGCIRLEKPLALAERILELGKAADKVDPDRVLAEEEYRPVFLERQIPIFIEYFTARVDDEGRVNFLSDIYDYDEEQLGESS